jgi:hypothetical protein
MLRHRAGIGDLLLFTLSFCSLHKSFPFQSKQILFSLISEGSHLPSEWSFHYVVYSSTRILTWVSCSLNAGNMLAQGLGGLLAAGILSGMEGTRGIRGWRWVCCCSSHQYNISLNISCSSYSSSKALSLCSLDSLCRSSWQTIHPRRFHSPVLFVLYDHINVTYSHIGQSGSTNVSG